MAKKRGKGNRRELEVSNRTIVILLVIALGITVVSTLISVNKLVDFQTLLTGAASDTALGEANLTISQITSLTNHNRTLNFGSGYVNASCDVCGMDSNNTFYSYFGNGTNFSDVGSYTGTCCAGFERVPNGFLIENTGNQNLSIGYTCSGNCTHGKFIGGTLETTWGGIEIKIVTNNDRKQAGEDGSTDTVDSCTGGGAYSPGADDGFDGWNISNSSAYGNASISNAGVGDGVYIAMSSQGHWLCGNRTYYPLDYTNSKDAAVLDVNFTIPNDASATGLVSQFELTFNATSSA